MHNKQVAQSKETLQSVTALWQGPLPPPAVLRQYEAVLPGTAERILRLAERNMDLIEQESGQRHTAEMETIQSLVADNTRMHADIRRGQVAGFLVTLCAFAAALGAAALGAQVLGLAIVGTTIVCIVQALVVAGHSEKESRK